MMRQFLQGDDSGFSYLWVLELKALMLIIEASLWKYQTNVEGCQWWLCLIVSMSDIVVFVKNWSILGWRRSARQSGRGGTSTRSRHLSLIAPSNVSFSVKGGGTFGGPQLFSFCTWKLFAFQGSSGHQWQKNIQSPLFWPELFMQYNESEVLRIIPPNLYYGLDN